MKLTESKLKKLIVEMMSPGSLYLSVVDNIFSTSADRINKAVEDIISNDLGDHGFRSRSGKKPPSSFQSYPMPMGRPSLAQNTWYDEIIPPKSQDPEKPENFFTKKIWTFKVRPELGEIILERLKEHGITQHWNQTYKRHFKGNVKHPSGSQMWMTVIPVVHGLTLVEVHKIDVKRVGYGEGNEFDYYVGQPKY